MNIFFESGFNFDLVTVVMDMITAVKIMTINTRNIMISIILAH